MSDIYKIGVSIALANGVSPVLGVIARDLLGVHNRVQDTEKGFSRLKLAIGGVVAIAGGLAILHGFKAPLDEAKQFQTQVANFRQFGMSDAINAAAEHYARATKVIGTSATQMMRNMVEAQGVFRESGEMTERQALLGSKIAAPILAKIQFANAALNPEHAADFDASAMNMLRFIEARGGANDPRTFAQIADWGFKLITSSGHNIDWGQLRGLVKTAGAAGFNLTEDAVSQLEPVITDMGGGTVGSGLRVAFQRLMGTQRGLPRQAVQEYLSLGLWDPTKVELTKGGGVKRFLGDPGAVLRDKDKFATAPVDYYMQDFLPAIEKKYGKKILGDTAEARTMRAAEISMVFGPGTAGNLFSQIDKQLPAIQRSIEAQKKALGFDAADKSAAGTLAGKEIILQRNWQTLMLQLGEQILPLAIKGMTALNAVVEKVSAFGQAHPAVMKVIAGLGLALSGALIVMGGVALIAAAVGAVAAGGVAAVATAVGLGIAAFLGVFTALNWGAIKRVLHQAEEGWDGFEGWVKRLVASLNWTAFKKVVHQADEAWTGFEHWVKGVVDAGWDRLKSAASAAWDFVKKVVDIGALIVTNPFGAAKAAADALIDHFRHPQAPPAAAPGPPVPLAAPTPPPAAPAPRLHGSAGADIIRFPAASERSMTPRVPPPANANMVQVRTTTMLDGRVIAETVSEHHADALDRTAAAVGSGVDPRMALLPVGYGA